MQPKKLKFIAFLFITSAMLTGQLTAQTAEQRVRQIRKLYAQTNERIAAGLADKSAGLHHAAVTIGGSRDGQQWRAVGSRNQTTEFYFDCELDEPECGEDARQFVVKIVGTYQAGSSLTSRFEYLFDDKGELVFAFTIEADDDNKPVERRIYFDGKKVIRVTRGGKNYDEKFPRQDAEAATEAEAAARELKNLFAAIYGGD